MILSVISIIIRLVSLYLIFFKVLPIQKREFNVENNGLKGLKMYLIGLSVAFILLGIFPFIYHVCSVFEVCDSSAMFDLVVVSNAMNVLVGSVMLYLIYTKRY